MTIARSQQIHVNDTPYYHCISRCVRRAFLCGDDKLTGKNYDHRKQWIVDKFKELSGVFAIDVCAYAVMSNHYHLVLHIDKALAEQWSADEVMEHWCSLFKGNMLVNRYRRGESLTKAELNTIDDIVAVWRKRLMDISWFMRCLNEAIARESNKEDNCTGRFWEGRFKSQALLDETALLTCMMYVDLNPVRASIAGSLEDSEFTSIQERIKLFAAMSKQKSKRKKQSKSNAETEQKPLLPFIGNPSLKKDEINGIHFSLTDYFELTEWTGQVIREDKKGHIPSHIQPILQKLGVQQENWTTQVKNFGRNFGRVVGPASQLSSISSQQGLWWIRGSGSCRCLYQNEKFVGNVA